MAADGLVKIASKDGPFETKVRLLEAIASRGLTIFVHVDHAAGAREAGMQLLPTDLFVFGSAQAGTPLMQMDQSLGIDLPVKALIIQDGQGVTYIVYDNVEEIVRRRGLGVGARPIAGKLNSVLAAIAKEAAGAE